MRIISSCVLSHHRTCRSAYGGFGLILSLLDSAYWTSSLLLYCRDTPYRLEKRVPLRSSDYYSFQIHRLSCETMHDSALRLDRHAVGYFGLCWLLDIRCYYPCGLPRPRGVSHTSFLVYLHGLRNKVTVAFRSFTVFSQLVRLMRLSTMFLFVRPRFRYCFFSPERHHSKLASRYGVRWQLRPAWTFTTDVWHARHTKKALRVSLPKCHH